MPRDLPLGNGAMQVNFDTRYQLRDIFWPHIGKENQTEGDVCHTGVWVEDGESGQRDFAWFGDDSWQRDIRYQADTMVTCVTLTNERLKLRIEAQDTVDFDRDIFLRRFDVTNLDGKAKEVRLFFHYDWHLYGDAVGDTVYFDPHQEGVNSGNFMVAYKEDRYFLMDGLVGEHFGVDSWACGVKEVGGAQGTWRDAEDGHLQRGPIAQGSVDCTLALHIEDAQPATCNTIYHWMVAGNTHKAAVADTEMVRERGPQSFIERTANYWRMWANKTPVAWGGVPEPLRDMYRRSLLIIRTQLDRHGAVIASTDFDILSFARDSYAYMWPRDAALVVHALDIAGFQDPSRALFSLIYNIITPQGYLLHKYTAAGTLGSSWHPWADSMGRPQLPIQEDETALIIYAMYEHYQKYHDFEFIAQFYRRVIKAAGLFMVAYREPHTGLPAPSYDLWEERRGIHSFTVGAVWAGLNAAASFCQLFGETKEAQDMRNAANEIKAAFVKHMYDTERKTFLRMINVDSDGNITKDYTMDSSTFGIVKFGMFDPTDVMVANTMRLMQEKLTIPTDVGGVARYENDYYQRASYEVTGNPWYICTLWMAQYHIATAQNRAELEPALKIMQWVADHSLPSGVLAEQIHPFSGAPLSVSPLTWSHAEFVETMNQYISKQQRLLMEARASEIGLRMRGDTPSGPVVEFDWR